MFFLLWTIVFTLSTWPIVLSTLSSIFASIDLTPRLLLTPHMFTCCLGAGQFSIHLYQTVTLVYYVLHLVYLFLSLRSCLTIEFHRLYIYGLTCHCLCFLSLFGIVQSSLMVVRAYLPRFSFGFISCFLPTDVPCIHISPAAGLPTARCSSLLS